MAQAPANIHLLANDNPVELEPGAVLLPAPLPRRYPGRDLTAHMPATDTPQDAFRIGLAHGAIQSFGENGSAADAIIPPDRATTARLDYLALGDWHGHLRVGDRTWYAGTPERDAFGHDGPGTCLAVTLPAPGAPPDVQVIPTGRFHWTDAPLPLVPGQTPAAALTTLLPADRATRRDHLIRIRATGRATLADRAALEQAAQHAQPDFALLILDLAQLATEIEAADLDQIDRAGALRLAADRLKDRADDATADPDTRRIAAAALNRLYGYLQGDRA